MSNPIAEASKILFQTRLDNSGAIFKIGDQEIKGIYSDKKNLLEFFEALEMKKGDIVERKVDGKKLKVVRYSDKYQGEIFIHRDFEVQEVDETPQETPNQQ